MVIEEKFVLAPGVLFYEREHEYLLNGKKLSGVTGIIGKHLGTKMPEEFVGEARGEGLHVHRAIENWITKRDPNSVHSGVLWLIATLPVKKGVASTLHAETLVSDLRTYASAIDISAEYDGNVLDIFDMKRTFKRSAVTWQLSIYKYFIETHTPYKVDKMWCSAFRDKEHYPIFAKSFDEVENLLYGNGGTQCQKSK